MEKLDFVKTHKTYYTAKTKPELVEVEPANYLSVAGKGDPDAEAFALRTQAIYSLTYRIKFMCKALKKDFTVAKLEGLWWFNEETWGQSALHGIPLNVPRSEWEYRLLIRLPDYVVQEQIREAILQAMAEKPNPCLQAVEMYQTPKETAVQILHVGPFHTEPESLEKIQAFMAEHGLEKAGLHHEIYLSDFRKTLSDKLRTILRQPVKNAEHFG